MNQATKTFVQSFSAYNTKRPDKFNSTLLTDLAYGYRPDSVDN